MGSELRIGITDSGVGGLSICAEVEARLRRNPVQQDIEILYLNAALEDDDSFNSLHSRQEKLQTFDRFLHAAADRYQPDSLFIACNTLSVLFEDPHFVEHRQIPIKGIVETGTGEMIKAYQQDPEIGIIVFATPTTIEEKVYSRNLGKFGIPANRIVEQACPGLADAISNDATGMLASVLLDEYIGEALEQFENTPKKVLAFLGCTHYGYQAGLFKKGLQAHVAEVRVLNPNPVAASFILSSFNFQPGQGNLNIKFITRYAIPENPRNGFFFFYALRGPAALSALRNFIHLPKFF